MGNQSQIYVGVIWKYVSEFRMEKNVFYIRNFIENVEDRQTCISLSKTHSIKGPGFIQTKFEIF